MDLNEEAKERLFLKAKRDLERQFGKHIGQQAKHGLAKYKQSITVEAQRKLCDEKYSFSR